MPFSVMAILSQIKTTKSKNYDHTYRKENDSNISNTLPQCMSIFYQKRASTCTSKKQWKLNGSITIEVALTLPLFFIAVVSLIYMLEIMTIQCKIRGGMHAVGRQISQEICGVPMIIINKVETDIGEIIGTSRLDRSLIIGGSSGLDCNESYVSTITGIIDIKVKYRVQLPFPAFEMCRLSFVEHIKIKGWTGYVKNTMGEREDQNVYITDTGMVFHKDYHCTHLQLSIKKVKQTETENMRNDYNEKYVPCEKCPNDRNTFNVYITNSGNKYHSRLECSGLKRSIYMQPLSEVIGKGACSRCGN